MDKLAGGLFSEGFTIYGVDWFYHELQLQGFAVKLWKLTNENLNLLGKASTENFRARQGSNINGCSILCLSVGLTS